MYHKEFCKALWGAPLDAWDVGEAVGHDPELSVAGHVISLLQGGAVSVNGIRFDLAGLGDLRSKVIEHWLDHHLGELTAALKRDCLGG